MTQFWNVIQNKSMNVSFKDREGTLQYGGYLGPLCLQSEISGDGIASLGNSLDYRKHSAYIYSLTSNWPRVCFLRNVRYLKKSNPSFPDTYICLFRTKTFFHGYWKDVESSRAFVWYERELPSSGWKYARYNCPLQQGNVMGGDTCHTLMPSANLYHCISLPNFKDGTGLKSWTFAFRIIMILSSKWVNAQPTRSWERHRARRKLCVLSYSLKS